VRSEECRLAFGGDHLEAVGVEVVEEGVAFGDVVGGLDGEEAVEEAHLGVDGVGCGDPVDGAFDLAAVGGVAAAGGGVVGAVDAGDAAVGVFLDAVGGDEVGVAQAHLLADGHAEVFLGGFLHEVLALDPELAAEGHLAGAVFGALGVVDGGEHLGLPFGIVVYDDLDGVEDGHAALGIAVEVLAEGELEEAVVDDVVALGDADAVAEGADALGGVAAAAEAADGGHAGVVPAADVAFLDQLQQLALGHDGVVDIEAGELVLVGGPDAELLDEPVVERAVDVELQRADAVGDMLDGVGLAVGVVVHGVDAPAVARAVVVGMEDAVHDGVAEHHVGVGHVDFGAEHLGAVGELAVAHAAEEVEVLLGGAVAEGAVGAGGGDGAAAGAYLVERLVVDIGQTFLYQQAGPFVELLEIVGGVVDFGPVETEPADVLLYGVDILGVLLDGVGVVEAEVGAAAIFLGEAEVDADALGVADVEVAVGLGREAGLHGGAAAFGEVALDDFLQKVQLAFGGVFFHNRLIV